MKVYNHLMQQFQVISCNEEDSILYDKSNPNLVELLKKHLHLKKHIFVYYSLPIITDFFSIFRLSCIVLSIFLNSPIEITIYNFLQVLIILMYNYITIQYNIVDEILNLLKSYHDKKLIIANFYIFLNIILLIEEPQLHYIIFLLMMVNFIYYNNCYFPIKQSLILQIGFYLLILTLVSLKQNTLLMGSLLIFILNKNQSLTEFNILRELSDSMIRLDEYKEIFNSTEVGICKFSYNCQQKIENKFFENFNFPWFSQFSFERELSKLPLNYFSLNLENLKCNSSNEKASLLDVIHDEEGHFVKNKASLSNAIINLGIYSESSSNRLYMISKTPFVNKKPPHGKNSRKSEIPFMETYNKQVELSKFSSDLDITKIQYSTKSLKAKNLIGNSNNNGTEDNVLKVFNPEIAGKDPNCIFFIIDVTDIISHQHSIVDSNYKNIINAKLSHEITSPCLAVSTVISILQKKLKKFLDRKKLKVCYKDIVKLDSLNEQIQNSILVTVEYINGLRNTKVKSELIELKKLTDFAFNLIVSNLHNNKSKNIRPKNDFQIDEDIKDVLILIDFSKMKLAISEVVKNSIKFTHEGEIIIKVYFKKDKTKIYLNIIDTGSGINDKTLKEIIDKFSTLEDRYFNSYPENNSVMDIQSIAKKQIKHFFNHAGLNLGLEIIKIICLKSDVKVEIKSAPSRGTSISFEFKIAKFRKSFKKLYYSSVNLFKKNYSKESTTPILDTMKELNGEKVKFEDKISLENSFSSKSELPDLNIVKNRNSNPSFEIKIEQQNSSSHNSDHLSKNLMKVKKEKETTEVTTPAFPLKAGKKPSSELGELSDENDYTTSPVLKLAKSQSSELKDCNSNINLDKMDKNINESNCSIASEIRDNDLSENISKMKLLMDKGYINFNYNLNANECTDGEKVKSQCNSNPNDVDAIQQKDRIKTLLDCSHISNIVYDFDDVTQINLSQIMIENEEINKASKANNQAIKSPKKPRKCNSQIINVKNDINEENDSMTFSNILDNSSIRVDDSSLAPTGTKEISKNNNKLIQNTTVKICDEYQTSSGNSKIVIVDDQFYCRKILKNLVQQALRVLNIEKKFDIIKSSDGIDTLNLVIRDQKEGNKIKLIISDENMDFINGSQSFNVINNLIVHNKVTVKIPMVILTALGEEDAHRKILNVSNADMIIKKPASKFQIVELLQKFLIFS